MGRNAEHRLALMRNLTMALIQHERIITTVEYKSPDFETDKNDTDFDANNHIRQDQAMMALDVSDQFGSMEKAAAAVKAKVLVIVALRDHTVTPGPALEFGKQIHAEMLTVDNECGHQLMSCENDRVVSAVAAFLQK